jgi:Fur family transcriptional regulator, peroxide stress response regulator
LTAVRVVVYNGIAKNSYLEGAMDGNIQYLKENGYKMTRQRQAILIALAVGHPLDAEEIYLRVKNDCRINLSTIYRNLHILLEMGLARKVNSPEQADRFEPVGRECRHTLSCSRCGTQVTLAECAFGKLIQGLEAQTRFKIDRHHLELFGTCPRCEKDQSERGRRRA